MHTQKSPEWPLRQFLIEALITILITGVTFTPYANWDRIVLAGVDITAITTGTDIFHNKQPIVIIGTENGDVLSVSGPNDTIEHYPPLSYSSTDKRQERSAHF